MDASLGAGLIGLLVCVGAVMGLVYTTEKEYDCSYARGKDQRSLVGALLMGVFLLWLVLSGTYSDPKYAERVSKRPYKSFEQRSGY